MDKGNKYCYNCMYYKPYYTKEGARFDKSLIGRCSKDETTVGHYSSCEEYSFAHYASVSRREAALTALTENINILTELKQILEEDDDAVFRQMLLNYKDGKK